MKIMLTKNYRNNNVGSIFLTLPLIWFMRDFSIRIVNFSISLVSKGWKKL